MSSPSGCAEREPDGTRFEIVPDSDSHLLHRIGEGDSWAFAALYRRNVRPVYGLALRRLREPDRAAAAVHDAFRAVWTSAAAYQHEHDSTLPWLFRVVYDAVTDVNHARGRDRGLPVVQPHGPVADDPGSDESAEQAWVFFRVHVAVSELPEHERVPLELAYWHGRSVDEIARELGLPMATVATRARIGLARLAALLEGTA